MIEAEKWLTPLMRRYEPGSYWNTIPCPLCGHVGKKRKEKRVLNERALRGKPADCAQDYMR